MRTSCNRLRPASTSYPGTLAFRPTGDTCSVALYIEIEEEGDYMVSRIEIVAPPLRFRPCRKRGWKVTYRPLRVNRQIWEYVLRVAQGRFSVPKRERTVALD